MKRIIFLILFLVQFSYCDVTVPLNVSSNSGNWQFLKGDSDNFTFFLDTSSIEDEVGDVTYTGTVSVPGGNPLTISDDNIDVLFNALGNYNFSVTGTATATADDGSTYTVSGTATPTATCVPVTVIIDSINPIYLAKGKGKSASINFTIASDDDTYIPSSVSMTATKGAWSFTWNLPESEYVGSHTVGLIEGTDLPEVGNYSVTIKVDNLYESSPAQVTVFEVGLSTLDFVAKGSKVTPTLTINPIGATPNLLIESSNVAIASVTPATLFGTGTLTVNGISSSASIDDVTVKVKYDGDELTNTTEDGKFTVWNIVLTNPSITYYDFREIEKSQYSRYYPIDVEYQIVPEGFVATEGSLKITNENGLNTETTIDDLSGTGKDSWELYIDSDRSRYTVKVSIKDSNNNALISSDSIVLNYLDCQFLVYATGVAGNSIDGQSGHAWTGNYVSLGYINDPLVVPTQYQNALINSTPGFFPNFTVTYYPPVLFGPGIVYSIDPHTGHHSGLMNKHITIAQFKSLLVFLNASWPGWDLISYNCVDWAISASNYAGVPFPVSKNIIGMSLPSIFLSNMGSW